MNLILLSLMVSNGQEPLIDIERKILAALPAYTEIKREPIRGVTGGVWLRVLGKIPVKQVGGGQGAESGKSVKVQNPEPIQYEPQEIQIILTPGRPTAGGLTVEFQHSWLGVRHRQYTEQAYLGIIDGYQWHVKMPVYERHALAEKIGLGCDEKCHESLAKGLFITDDGWVTANSNSQILSEKGAEAIPAILTEIIRLGDRDPWRAIMTVGMIEGDLATNKLKEWYWSVDKKISDAAAYGLIQKPSWRKDAKAEFVDMLDGQRYVEDAIRTASAFKWDIQPQLRLIVDKPASFDHYRRAYWALREREEAPLTKLTEAEELAMSRDPKSMKEAAAIILGHGDKEGAAISAQYLATVRNKSNYSVVNELGKNLLMELPRDAVEKMQAKLPKPG